MKEKSNENDRICNCCGAVMARDEGTVFDSCLLAEGCTPDEIEEMLYCGAV